MENTINTGVQLNTNNELQKKKNNEVQIFQNKKASASTDTVDLSAKLEKAKKQNGLIEKATDKIKGKLNIGMSSKKIEEKITKGADEKEILSDIKKYKRQQENTAHAIVDTITGVASLLVFAKLRNTGLINKYKGLIAKRGIKQNVMGSLGITLAMYTGGISKFLLMKLNRIGTDKYKVKKDENMDDDQWKILKNANRKDKANAGFRNFASGAISGLTTPLIVLGGGFIGAPLYVLANSLSRYFIGTKEDASEKSMSSYLENLKTSGITNALSAGALLAVAMKKGVSSAQLEKNLKVAYEKIATLTPYSDGKSTYEKLADVLLNSDDAQKVLNGSVNKEGLKKLTEDNFMIRYTLGIDNTECESLIKEISGKIGENNGVSKNQIKAYVSDWLESKPELDKSKAHEITNFIMEKCGKECKTADEMYQALSDNTFFLKILQIQEDKQSGNGMLDMFSSLFGMNSYDNKLKELTKKLKTDGPRTYSPDEAKELIEKAFGGKYTLANNDPLGVGTVAETYLVKDKSGKEVVAKLLKKGVDKDGGKIAKDAEKCLEIIKNADLPEHEKATLLSSFDDIAKGVIKEADLAHEMEAAKKLSQSTKLAKVAQGIEVSKNGSAYVMEKADGFCLQKVSDYLTQKRNLENEVSQLKGLINASATGQKSMLGELSNPEELKKELSKATKRLEEFNKKNAGMSGFSELGNDEARKMLELYQDVLVEQFNKVDPKGKVIHADIHPGNIMINSDELKKFANGDRSAKTKIFTLIDTGNTIEQTPEVAMRFLNLSKYIDNADVDNITEFVLEGAKLPNGKIYKRAGEGANIASKEEMDKYFNIIKEKLAGKDGKSGVFFDSETGLGKLTNQELIENITNKMLNEEGITPSNVQGNLIKAQTSAKNSLAQFRKNNNKTLFQSLTGGEGGSKNIIDMFKTLRNPAGYRAKQKKQEKLNLQKLSPALKAKMKKDSKNIPSKTSVEYLTYILKQDKVSEKTQDTVQFLDDIFG